MRLLCVSEKLQQGLPPSSEILQHISLEEESDVEGNPVARALAAQRVSNVAHTAFHVNLGDLASSRTSLLDLTFRLTVEHVLLLWREEATSPEDEVRWAKVLRALPPDLSTTVLQPELLSTVDLRKVLGALQPGPLESKMGDPGPVHGVLLDTGQRIPLDCSGLELQKRIFRSCVLEEELLSLRAAEIYTRPDPDPPPGGFSIYVSEPYVPEASIQAVTTAAKERRISSSTKAVKELACELQEHFAVPHVQLCASGYDALVLALQCAQVGPGDEVVLPAFTFVAVYNAVTVVGATPVLVDCAPGDYNPSAEQFAAAGSSRTKALIVTHTLGISADIVPIATLCAERSWYCIEDISEALGGEAQGRPLGLFGDFAASSLFANKLVTSGDGGFVFSKHSCFGSSLSRLASHGGTFGRGDKSWRFIHGIGAGNCKMSGLAAACCAPTVRDIPQLREQRRRFAEWYRQELERAGLVSELGGKCPTDKHAAELRSLEVMPVDLHHRDVPWLVGLHCASATERDLLREHLAQLGIETRRYFLPMHLQPFFEGQHVPMERSEFLAARGISLPTHICLSHEDVKAIVKAIASFFSAEVAVQG